MKVWEWLLLGVAFIGALSYALGFRKKKAKKPGG